MQSLNSKKRIYLLLSLAIIKNVIKANEAVTTPTTTEATSTSTAHSTEASAGHGAAAGHGAVAIVKPWGASHESQVISNEC